METEAQAKEQLRQRLSSPKWRCSNLYSIKQEGTGKLIKFRPKKEQEAILDALELGYQSIFVPKSRRLGVSTVSEIVGIDRAIWQAGFESALVDRKEDEATKKLKNIARVALSSLDDHWKQGLRIGKDNDSQLEIIGPDGQASNFWAGVQFRGGDAGFLHISELGWTQWWDPKRAEEIVTGSLTAARKGIRLIETTWKGGKRGEAWDILEPALQLDQRYRTLRDWLVLFFPWYGDPASNWDGNTAQITKQCNDYLDKMEAQLGIKFEPGQRLWYFKEAWRLGNRRFEEYPTTLEEALTTVVDGAIYEWEANQIITSGRMVNFALEKGIPVVASFDLGYNDFMPCSFIQCVGKDHRVFDYHCAYHEEVSYYIDMLKAWQKEHDVPDLVIRLPHDASSAGKLVGKTVANKFRNGGFTDVQVVPRAKRVWTGIDVVRDVCPNLWLHADNCQKEFRHGTKKLPSLWTCFTHYHSRETSDGMIAKSEPVHDEYSHGCDSLRTYAEGWGRGMIATPAGRPQTYDAEMARQGYPEYQRSTGENFMSDNWEGLV